MGMVRNRSTTLSEQLYSLANRLETSNPSDRELLDRFIDTPDEETFAAILRRFGPLVLRVCNRVVGDRHFAEDAFQATFLVFVQKAKTLLDRDRVSNWLYGVAYRISLEARRKKYKQAQRGALSLTPSAESEASTREMASLIDEELHRLPEEYRTPFLLCFVEGLTQDQVALRLGISLRTLTRRLEKGKELLKVRLSRRGVSLSSVLIAATTTSGTSLLSVDLVHSLTQNVSNWISRTSLAPSEIPPNLISLAESGIAKPVWSKMMTWVGILISGTILFTICLFGFSEPQTKSEEPKKEIVQKKSATLESVSPLILDPNSEQLPQDAIARIGTTGFRHAAEVTKIAYSPDSRWLVSISTDSRDSSARVWDTKTGKEQLRVSIQLPERRNDPRQAPRAIGFSSDSKQVYLADLATLRGFDIASGKETFSQKIAQELPNNIRRDRRDQLSGLSFTPDSKKLLIAWPSGEWEIRDVASGAKRVQGSHSFENYPYIPISFSPNGKFFSIHEPTKKVLIYSAESGKEVLQVKEVDHQILSATFLHDNKTIVAATYSRQGFFIHLFDLTSGTSFRHFQVPRISEKIALSFDGKFIAIANQDGMNIQLYEIESGKQIGNFMNMPSLTDLTFSPDGKWLAATQYGSNTITIWDVQKRTFQPLVGEPYSYRGTIFTPDSRALILPDRFHTRIHWRTGKTMEQTPELIQEGRYYELPTLSPGGNVYALPHSKGFLQLLDTQRNK
jgi:RNA polymerase sigma factor (sigma-70 family)